MSIIEHFLLWNISVNNYIKESYSVEELKPSWALLSSAVVLYPTPLVIREYIKTLWVYAKLRRTWNIPTFELASPFLRTCICLSFLFFLFNLQISIFEMFWRHVLTRERALLKMIRIGQHFQPLYMCTSLSWKVVTWISIVNEDVQGI